VDVTGQAFSFANSNGVPIVNTVRVRENGPLAFEAELQIRGEAQVAPRATSCRYGQNDVLPRQPHYGRFRSHR
jgi:hypothetical protein